MRSTELSLPKFFEIKKDKPSKASILSSEEIGNIKTSSAIIKTAHILDYDAPLFLLRVSPSNCRPDDHACYNLEVLRHYCTFLGCNGYYADIRDASDTLCLKDMIESLTESGKGLVLLIDSRFKARADIVVKIAQYIHYCIQLEVGCQTDSFVYTCDYSIHGGTEQGNAFTKRIFKQSFTPFFPVLGENHAGMIAITVDCLIKESIPHVSRTLKLSLDASGLFLHTAYSLLSPSLLRRARLVSIPSPLLSLSIEENNENNVNSSRLYPLSDSSAFVVKYHGKAIKAYSRFQPKNDIPNALADSDSVKYNQKQSCSSILAIIPFRNHLSKTTQCLAALKSQLDVSIISMLVDNGSSPCQSLDTLLGDSDISVQLNTGYNYSQLNNYAFRHAAMRASFDYVLFLNNDVYLQNDCLRLMKEWLSDYRCGAVGAKLFYPTGTIQHGGVSNSRLTWRHSLPWGHIDAGLAESQNCKSISSFSHYAESVTAACMLMPRTIFEVTGGFNEAIFPIGHSDTDLCRKIRALDKYIVFDSRAKGIHDESISRGTSYPDDLEAILAYRMRYCSLLTSNLTYEVI